MTSATMPGARRADRETNADLAPPLCHHERQHPVHAEDGQQQREPGECAEQLRQEPRPADRFIEHRIHLAQADDGDRRVDGADRSLQRRREHRRLEIRAQGNIHGFRSGGDPALCSVDRRPGLIDEQIDLRTGVPLDTGLLDVLRHADHGVPWIEARA
jgi:hypothetical protein